MQIITADDLRAKRVDVSERRVQVEPFYSGNEHGQNFAYYASDDEFLCDTDPVLDQVALALWLA
jgi:hypothetical protein